MRPKTQEKYVDFIRRYMNDRVDLPEGERAVRAQELWAAGPPPAESGLFDACCRALGKQDVPDVEAVRLLLAGTVLAIWEESVDRVIEVTGEAQREDKGPEWILLLGTLIWQELWSAPTAAQKSLIRDAARRLGAGEKASTAANDLLLQIRGKFQREWAQISPLLQRGVAGEELRPKLKEVFGEPSKWLNPTVDTWAYKWHWIGEALVLRTRGTRLFRYWNPLDIKTTPFCRWLVESGRTISMARILKQVNKIEQAIIDNNVELSLKAWPLLSFKGTETAADFNRLYVENDLTSPPFHFYCRTQLLAI